MVSNNLVSVFALFWFMKTLGLTDTPGSVQELVLDVDDALLKNEKRSISRSDVANLCVAALTVGKGKKISFDCITKEVGADQKVKSAKEALEEFLATDKTANYDL